MSGSGSVAFVPIDTPATAANQVIEIASLASIDAGIPSALGQTTAANSMSVVVASDQTQLGPVTPGTVAPKSALQGGQFNTTLPTLTAAQQSALQLDSRGRLITAPMGLSYFHPIYVTKLQTVGAGTPGGTVASLAVTTTATKAGSLLVVTAACQTSTLTVTDSASQVYTTATSQASGANNFYTFFVANSVAGVTSVTITPAAAARMTIIVSEYQNMATVSPLDKTSTNSQAAVTSWTSNNTAATTQATELLVGSALDFARNNNTFTAGTNWTANITQANAGGGSLLTSFQEQQFVTTTGASAATGTNGTSSTILSSIATFKVSTSNGITIPNVARIIKSGSGELSKITINTVGSGGASVTFYDSLTASGDIIATVSLLAQETLTYDLSFTTGLTMVVNSSTPDFTVIYD